MTRKNLSDEEKKFEEALARAEAIEESSYATKSSTVNVADRAFKTAARMVSAGKWTQFKPRMLYDSIQENNPKYFADLLWTHSDIDKNLRANPKNKVLYTQVERGWYTVHPDALAAFEADAE